MSRMSDIMRRLGSRIAAFWHDRSIGTFCLFLLFAAMLWLGHAMNAVRERTLTIGIEFEGVPERVAFENDLPREFRVTVRDQGKRLRAYRDDGIAPVQIDLSQQLKAETGTVHISAEQVRGQITDRLQGTAKLQRIMPDQITADYYRQQKKSLPVRLTGECAPAPQYQFEVLPALMPHSVIVYGKPEALDTLSFLATEPVRLSEVKDTLNVSVRLAPPEGVRPAEQMVTLTAVAEPYTEKHFTLPIATRGVPEGTTLRVFPSRVDVYLRVGISHFNEVDQQSVQALCHYPRTQAVTLPVELKYTTPYITGTRVTPQEVEFVIEKQ